LSLNNGEGGSTMELDKSMIGLTSESYTF